MKVEPVLVGIVCLCLFFFLIYIGMPIGFAFMAVGFLGFGLDDMRRFCEGREGDSALL